MKYPTIDPPVLFVREPTDIGAYEAKTRLGELLTEVERGASFVITKHGRPVARLLPVAPASESGAVVDALLDARGRRTLGTPLRALIEEGRR